MTPEEAIKLLDEKTMIFPARCNGKTKAISDARELAVKALDKQIPKKPEKEAEDNLLCPACSGFLGYESECKEEPYQLPYCSGCGQAIDWTDWEK